MSSQRGRSLALSFVDRYGLWSEAQAGAAAAVDKAIVDKNLELVRFSFPDQHGVLRGKTVVSKGTFKFKPPDGESVITEVFDKQ